MNEKTKLAARLVLDFTLAFGIAFSTLAAQEEWHPTVIFGGAGRNRTADKGFADPCLATWLPRRKDVASHAVSNV